MNLAPVLWLCALDVCVVVAVALLAYRAGRKRGNAERCGRHSHAERVAAGRTEAPQHNGPPARVTSADFRHTRMEESDDL